MVKLHLNSLPLGVITLEPLFSNFIFQMAAHEEDFLDNIFSCTHNKINIFFSKSPWENSCWTMKPLNRQNVVLRTNSKTVVEQEDLNSLRKP